MLENNNSHKYTIAAGQNVQQREYWMSKLSGDLVKSTFNYDFPKDNKKQPQLAAERFNFPDQTASLLMNLSTRNDAKLHMILTTGLFILLSKYTGNQDILIGSPILKQENQKDYINTILVFRNSVNDENSFKQLLLQLRETIIDANKNQNYPIERLSQRLNLTLSENEFPFFNVATWLDNLYDKTFLTPIPVDLAFGFVRNGESISGEIIYNSLLYTPQTIKQLTTHFINLIHYALQNMDLPISHLPLMTPEESKHILHDFNQTQSPYPSETTATRLFVETVSKFPENIAIIGQSVLSSQSRISTPNNISLTYTQLYNQSQQLAYRLNQNGCGEGSIIAIMIEPSIEMITGLLGIWLTHAAYLPIDPSTPPHRIQFMLKDSAAAILITTHTIMENIPLTFDTPTLFIDSPNSFSNTSSPDLPSLASYLSSNNETPTNPAYIIYTSGTTGIPKGVITTHRNLVAYLHAFWGEFPIHSNDIAIQLTTYTFDLFVEEIFPLLLRGGKVFIPTKDNIRDFDLLTRLIAEHAVTIIDCTPLLLNQFNLRCNPGSPQNPFSSVHTFISGGDVLKEEYIDKLAKTANIYNTYGPTESTICATYYKYPAPPHSHDFSLGIPIGKPILNYNLYILDKNKNPVPFGVDGELYIAGPGVASGYLNRPQATHETFFNPPSWFTSSQTLYKSGDTGRWLQDGNIRFSGRVDHQVKIRGYRIELGEIEDRLLKHPSVKESFVTIHEDQSGEKYIYAYIVPHSTTHSELQDPSSRTNLENYLSNALPEYMIPSQFIFLEKMPLTNSGKIDRKALPQPDLTGGSSYIAPRDALETELVLLWAEVLKIDQAIIGINSNFFQLGGNSFKAPMIVSEIQKKYNIGIPLVEVFKNQTIDTLAQYIRSAETEPTISDDCLVKLSGGTGKEQPVNLFLIHDGTGDVEGYFEFCKLIDKPVICWGLRVNPNDPDIPRNISIPQIAAHYVQIIQKVHPSGNEPYAIAGWSLGGTIAFEIALQLERAGEKISFLGLFDVPGPQKNPQYPPHIFDFDSEVAWIKQYLPYQELHREIENTKNIKEIWDSILIYLEKNTAACDRIEQMILNDFAQGIPEGVRMPIKDLIFALNVNRMLLSSRDSYFPSQKLNSQVHYFKAAESKLQFKESWDEYCESPITLHQIPGTHFTIFQEPNITETVKTFEGVFNREYYIH